MMYLWEINSHIGEQCFARHSSVVILSSLLCDNKKAIIFIHSLNTGAKCMLC